MATGLGLSGVAGPVALTTATHRGPVRFGADAAVLLVLDGAQVRVVDVAPGTFARVPSRFGYPFGDIDAPAPGGTVLAAGSGPRMLRMVARRAGGRGGRGDGRRARPDRRLHARAQAVRPGDRIVPGGSASSRRADRAGRGRPLAGARGGIPRRARRRRRAGRHPRVRGRPAGVRRHPPDSVAPSASPRSTTCTCGRCGCRPSSAEAGWLGATERDRDPERRGRLD